jgi:hypothetical protein
VASAVALGYYALVLDAVMRLGRVAWYHRAPWVSTFRDSASNAV